MIASKGSPVQPKVVCGVIMYLTLAFAVEELLIKISLSDVIETGVDALVFPEAFPFSTDDVHVYKVPVADELS